MDPVPTQPIWLRFIADVKLLTSTRPPVLSNRWLNAEAYAGCQSSRIWGLLPALSLQSTFRNPSSPFEKFSMVVPKNIGQN